MNRTAFGCLAAFGVPFLAAGIAVLATASGDGHEGTMPLAAQVAAGGLFAAVGAGIIAVAVYGYRANQRQADLRLRHPEEPWRWRPDWDAGRITGSTRATMLASWGMALFWNVIAWTSAAAAWGQVDGWRLAAVALFPVVGVGLLVWAVRATVRHRTYGLSVLELSTLPGVIGRGLSGTVLVPASGLAAAEFEVVLRRIERTRSGSGRNASTHESIRWEERARVQGRRDARGTAIPIAFRIPTGELPTTMEPGKDHTLWRLDVSAEAPGVDYHSSFEVPVFDSAGSAALPPFTAPVAMAGPAEYRQPRESPIVVSESRRGVEIDYPARRNPGAAAGLTLFLIVWGGIVVVLVRSDAPAIFAIVFGAFALLLLVGVIQLWFGTTHVVVGDGEAIVRNGLFGGGRERRLARADVAKVEVRIGMQAGSRAYYDVRIVRETGRAVPAGSGIRDKREAEWLAWRIERALGLHGPADS